MATPTVEAKLGLV